MAIDSAAAFRPAKTPVFSGGISAVSSGQVTAVAAPLPMPASSTTTIVSGRVVTSTPPIALSVSNPQPIASTRRVPMPVGEFAEPDGPHAP